MKLFELISAGPAAGDCTAPYNIRFNRECTVQEFIDEVLKRNEWGYISFSDYVNGPRAEYQNDKLLTPLSHDILEMPIVSATAHGGWYRMDYNCCVKSEKLSHDVVVNGVCMMCGEELKSDEGLFLCKRCQKVIHIMQSTKGWHKMNWEDTSELKDHYYYLVTHTDYKTPMKAKWHDEAGGCFEVIGVSVSGSLHEYDVEFVWSWSCESEDHNPIIAWMEMPDIYKES